MEMDAAERKAHARINSLADSFSLSFTHNAGGGEFFNEQLGSCQIHMQNYADDLKTLEAWLRVNFNLELPEIEERP